MLKTLGKENIKNDLLAFNRHNRQKLSGIVCTPLGQPGSSANNFGRKEIKTNNLLGKWAKFNFAADLIGGDKGGDLKGNGGNRNAKLWKTLLLIGF